MEPTLDLFVPRPNYAGQKVLLGLSGGINSAALLCWMAEAPEDEKPAELHLLSHQFAEHPDDTAPFIEACRVYARAHFPCVVVEETENSALAFFEDINMIPHPKLSPCTRLLKVVPSMAYMARHGIIHNLVGYVQSEKKRTTNMKKKGVVSQFGVTLKDGIEAAFLISQFTDRWCMYMVDAHIGWHPAIYDHRWNHPGFVAFMKAKLAAYALTGEGMTERDRRAIKTRLGKKIPVFDHNNCLPCKNMNLWQLLCVEFFYPEKWAAARATEAAIGAHWGRDEAPYRAQFGYYTTAEEAGTPCGVCALD